jgi:hypothetical protein
MKIQPKLLAAISFGIVAATFSSCNTSSDPGEADHPSNDTVAVVTTDSVSSKDSLCFPECGLKPADTLKTGIISDEFDCPACGMG